MILNAAADALPLSDAAETIADMRERWPAHIAELTDLIQWSISQGLPDLDRAKARQLAARLTVDLANSFGGSTVYYPKPDAIARAVRDLQIWAEHDGTRTGPSGIDALVRRYGLSANQVWSILRQQRALHERACNARNPSAQQGG